MKTLKSIGSVLAAILINVILSGITDIILESTGVMKIPFVNNPGWIIFLALFYRAVYTVVSGYVVAALAPGNPMKHAIILGVIGIVISIVAAIPSWEMAPAWFLIGLIILAFPCTWLGGWLKMRDKAAQDL